MLGNMRKRQKMLICKTLSNFFPSKLLFMLGLSCLAPVFTSLWMVSEIPREGAQGCLTTAMF